MNLRSYRIPIHNDNPYEIEAEEFGQKNWKKWHTQFKKEGLI